MLLTDSGLGAETPLLKETLVQVTLLKLFIFFFFFHFCWLGFFCFVLNFWICFLNGMVELEVELLSGNLLLLVGHSRTLGAFPAQRTAGELTGHLEFG